MKSRSILFYCLLLSSSVHSQTANIFGVHSTIDSNKLIGKWYPIATTIFNIEFVNYAAEFVLEAENHHPYYFSKDSLGNIFSNGYYPMWPPPACELSLLSIDTLKVSYSHSSDAGVSYLYIKQKK